MRAPGAPYRDVVKAPSRTVFVALAGGVALLVCCAACSSGQATPTEPVGEASGPAANAPVPSDAAPPDATGDGPATSGAPAATAAPEAGPKEVAKDANALILDVTVHGATGATLAPADGEKLKRSLLERIAQSGKIATPQSKGVTGTRLVTTRLMIETATEGKDGLTQRVTLNGVTANGRCPLFDLAAKATMSGARKDKSSDVDELRVVAVGMVFEKLEAAAPTLKPADSCSPENKK
jgi:hypothetical protein